MTDCKRAKYQTRSCCSLTIKQNYKKIPSKPIPQSRSTAYHAHDDFKNSHETAEYSPISHQTLILQPLNYQTQNLIKIPEKRIQQNGSTAHCTRCEIKNFDQIAECSHLKHMTFICSSSIIRQNFIKVCGDHILGEIHI